MFTSLYEFGMGEQINNDLKILQHSAENVNYVSSVFVKFVRVSISETLLIIFPLTQC